ncbi:MAG: Ig-like domain-containing protein [Longimicrobiaceae bacterium]
MRIGVIRRLLVVLSLALATSCGESSGGPTAPEPTGAGTQSQEGVHLVLAGGDRQSGFTGAPLASPVVVRALDARDQPVPGVALSFAAAAGGGSAAPAQVSTDAMGNAQAQWTLGAAVGAQTLQVSGPGGMAVTVTATAAAPVARVRIQPDSLALVVGSTGAVSATALDAQGNELAGRTVTWTISNAGVAALGAGGVVTAVAQGTATITATVEGITASIPVRVLPPPVVPVARVRIQPDSMVLMIGSSGTFSAAALDAQGNVLAGRTVTWTLANPQGGFGPGYVATLGAGAVVTGVGQGTATVTATVEGVSATATVRVIPVPVARLSVRPDSLDLLPGAGAELFAVALDAQGNVLTGRPVTWTSSDARVAAVGSTGTVAGVADGTATITATVEGISATARVRVRTPPPAAVATLELRPDSVTLEVGRQRSFIATARDVNGFTLSGRVVTWSISNPAVASFGASGGSLVTALAEGTTTITATSEGVSATATVRVVAPTSARVATVRIQPDSLALATGTTGNFDATALDAQGNVLTGRTVVWTTANALVASVGAGGTVTGVAQGSTQVTATVEGVAATAPVRVFRVPVARVRIQPDSLVLTAGSTGAFTATALDAQGNALGGRTVIWTISNTGVATLGAGGVVTGVAQGTATVNATVDGITASAAVRVLPRPGAAVARVRIQPDSMVLMIGSSGNFDATALDAQGNVLTGRTVTWTLANPQGGFGPGYVATLGAGGVVTGVGQGTATLTATVEGVSATATVRVIPVPVARLSVRPDSLDLLPGASVELFAVALDAQGNVLTGRPVKWESSDARVVAVGSTGTVAGVADGTATITATVEGISATARVRVRVPPPAPVATLDLSPDSVTLEVGKQRTFYATAKDANGNTLSGRVVTWSTSNPAVAAFGASGSLVTALAEGTATITATSEGISATATVRVVPAAPKVATVKVIPDTLSMFPGDSLQFRAVAQDAQGNVLTGLTVSWSGNSGYGTGAQVSRSGMVTAWAEGTTTVRATVSGVTGTSTVRVKPAPLSNVGVKVIRKYVPITGANLDVSTGPRPVRFIVEFTEAVKDMSLRIRSPGGMRIDCGRSYADNLFLKEYFCELEIPGGADPGLWRVEQLTLTTSNGSRTFSSGDLDAENVPGRGFIVFGSGTDRDAPVVTAVINHGWASGKYWIRYDLVDYVTGVRSSSATLRNVATGQTVSCTANSSYGVLAKYGSFLCPLDVPTGERWQLVSITVTDGVGNTATYTPAQIDAVRGLFEQTNLTYEFTS